MAHGPAHHLLPNRSALLVIALEQPRRSLTADRQRELPGEVVSILNAGVHPLRTRRGMNVGSISAQEDPPACIAIDQPVADAEDRRPAQVARPNRLGSQPVDHRLDVLKRGRWPVARKAMFRLGSS